MPKPVYLDMLINFFTLLCPFFCSTQEPSPGTHYLKSMAEAMRQLKTALLIYNYTVCNLGA